jgi:sialic acid synthase SpsE
MAIEIIAEIGQNHNGDMVLAKEMIHAVKEGGADVAKFQVFDVPSTFPPPEENPWYDYNCQTELSRDQVNDLAQECDVVGIEFMASAFDIERVGWLESVGVKRHKVASRSVKDQAFLAALAATGKPLLVSLGMWDGAAFPHIEGAKDVQFLYCISKYPTPLADVRLAQVDFSKYTGFSDHTLGIYAPVAAMARGARIIEKHFTIDKTMYGPDHEGSMDLEDLKALAAFARAIEECV